jgi:chaperonin cofactor prefoldin
VGIRNPAQALNDDTDDTTHLWRQVGDLIIRGQSRTDARLDHLEGRFDHLEGRFDHLEGRFDHFECRFDHLEGDVAVLKTEVAETKDRLGRLERATESRFNRVDAQLERLITLVQRAETKRS